MIKYLLWEIDSTIIDFVEAEYQAMHRGFRQFGIEIRDPDAISHYNAINDKYWLRLERGEIDRDEVLHGRFREFFDIYEVPYDENLVKDFNHFYQHDLGSHIFFNPHAKETLEKLAKDYKQYAVTNGSKIAQNNKPKKSGLDQIFDGVFISEDLGVDKPNKEFFDIVFDQIGSENRDDYIIIGDSLTSDMLGSNNAGIKNIWYNPEDLDNKANVKVDYTKRI